MPKSAASASPIPACALPALHRLHPVEQQMIAALRQVALAASQTPARHGPLDARLPAAISPSGFMLFCQLLSASWPEPFAVLSPCCRVLSHDEASLVRMLRCAAARDLHQFDRELADLIDPDARQQLFQSLCRLFHPRRIALTAPEASGSIR